MLAKKLRVMQFNNSVKKLDKRVLKLSQSMEAIRKNGIDLSISLDEDKKMSDEIKMMADKIREDFLKVVGDTAGNKEHIKKITDIIEIQFNLELVNAYKEVITKCLSKLPK